MDSYNGFLINGSVSTWLNNLPEFDVYITAHTLLCRTLVRHMINRSGRQGNHINAKVDLNIATYYKLAANLVLEICNGYTTVAMIYRP